MKKVTSVAAVIVTASTLTTLAGATSGSQQQAIRHQLHRYYHATGVIRSIGAVAHRTIYSSNPVVRRRWKRATHWLVSVRRDAKRKLYVLRHATAAGHWRGWSCITNGAYPGAPHEGNGYNGSYTGPLGMTTPWEGHYPTGSDWVHTPIAVVYAYAEEEASAQHFSYSWMVGQWPRTYPPCARFFR